MKDTQAVGVGLAGVFGGIWVLQGVGVAMLWCGIILATCGIVSWLLKQDW